MLSLTTMLSLSVNMLLFTAVSGFRVVLEPKVAVHDETRSSWTKQEKPAPDMLVNFTVVLDAGAGRKALEQLFWQVSDPTHAKYGEYLSIASIADVLAVPKERVQRVRDHFAAAGAQVSVSPYGDALTLTMRAADADAALATDLFWFKHKHHAQAPRIVRAASSYSLPPSIASDVLMVGELLQFPRVSKPILVEQGEDGQGGGLVGRGGDWPNACDAFGCKGFVTPQVLAQRYKLPNETAAAKPLPSSAPTTNTMAVAEFQFQYFRPADLASFSSACHRPVVVDKIIGGNRPTAGVESELDIEYIKSVAPDVPLTVVYKSSYSLLAWVAEITELADPPYVHSVSYGNDEAQQSSEEFMVAANTAFMKAGLRGLSILFASGDQGVCGREGCGIILKKFHPDFPAASPYITAVGGTNFFTDSIGEEEAWKESGGGFSNTFGIPDYQKDAVAAYLAAPDADLPPKAMWNSTGRGYPDVSALGGVKTPYCVCTAGRFAGVAGTSASCPVVAGVFARLNGLRLAAGKKVLGFLNPWIYMHASAFQDVKHGTNSDVGRFGFKAVKGWDAATGLGTPDFEKLSAAALATK